MRRVKIRRVRRGMVREGCVRRRESVVGFSIFESEE